MQNSGSYIYIYTHTGFSPILRTFTRYEGHKKNFHVRKIPMFCRRSWASLVAQLVKNLPVMWETWVWSPDWEDPLERGMATNSNILAWRIPWTSIVYGILKSQMQLLAWSEVKWSEVAHSCPTLCDPMDCSPPGSSVHGILQARILEWVANSFFNSLAYLAPIL